jgi:hypothetical protein
MAPHQSYFDEYPSGTGKIIIFFCNRWIYSLFINWVKIEEMISNLICSIIIYSVKMYALVFL